MDRGIERRGAALTFLKNFVISSYHCLWQVVKQATRINPHLFCFCSARAAHSAVSVLPSPVSSQRKAPRKRPLAMRWSCSEPVACHSFNEQVKSGCSTSTSISGSHTEFLWSTRLAFWRVVWYLAQTYHVVDELLALKVEQHVFLLLC